MLDKTNLPKFNSNLYHRLALNDLVIFSIHHFQQDGREITSEDVISACFLLFPKRFSMRNYPHWPDSAVVSRRWPECRSKGYLIGNAAEGFKLTAKGVRFAERVAKKLGVENPKSLPVVKVQFVKKAAKKPIIKSNKPASKSTRKAPFSKPNRKVTSIRPGKTRTTPQVTKANLPKTRTAKIIKARPPMPQVVKAQPKLVKTVSPGLATVTKEEKARAGKFVHSMEKSDAYLLYKKNGKNSRIGEFDFRSLLLCTMESSRETMLKNLKLFKGYADIQQRRDLLSFLDHCEDRFSYLLVPPQKQVRRPAKS